jgi:diaminopimelate epimerase
MSELRFWKGHGLGNDYLVVDAAALPFPLLPAHARALCDRHRGPGADGVLLADAGADPVGLRIVNPDGSEAEKSGNGLRILAAWLHGRGAVGDAPFPVALPGGVVELQVLAQGAAGVLTVRVEMGHASFRGEDAGFTPDPGEAGPFPLELAGGATALVHPVSLGNPHCVVFVDRLERDDFLRRAPLLCTHEAFARGTNVQFVRVAAPVRLEAWIWERGAGETLASGSSACAAAAVAVRSGRLPAGEVTVSMPGGDAVVDVGRAGAIRLTGPAQMLYAGAVLPALVESWRRLTA